MTELGELLGNNMKEQKNLSSTQGLNPSAISSYFVFADYKFRIRVTKILIEQQDVSGNDMIWGNATYGIWGTHKWADSFANSYAITEEILLSQTIPNTAKIEIIKWLTGDSIINPDYISLGTGTTPYSSDDTSLVSEIARKICLINSSTSKVATYQLEILSTDTEFQSNTFREVGLFNDDTSGTLFTRGIISSLTTSTSENTRITLTHEYADSSIGDSIMTDVGLNEIRDFMAGESVTSPTHSAWGTGTTSISASDTTLESEQQRNSISSIINNGLTATYESILDKSQANGTDITKSGLFNNSTGGTLFSESLFGAINKTSLFQVFQTDRISIL